MRPYKTVIYSFFLGGLLALIAQTFLVLTTATLTGTPLEFLTGSSVLVLMGVVGCIFGGLAIYQYFEEWATFGALLPFSGFAMAVGMKMIVPHCKGASTAQSIGKGLWLVIWFNAVGAVSCILFGYICAKAGVQAPVFEKTTSNMIFPAAFLMGGILTAFFQIVWLAYKTVSAKAAPVWVLLAAWLCGAIFAPCGLSGFLANTFGEGFTVMIPVGGYNMYNVGVQFAAGQVSAGITHLASFFIAVFFLFFTGLLTFLIYRAKYGTATVHEVHLARAKADVAHLSGEE